MRLHNRVIRPGFWQDTELIRNLPLAGRMYYIGLIQLADDSGCLYDDPLAHKIHLFPGDGDITEKDLTTWRNILVGLKKAIPYEVGEKKCLFLANFHKHQALRSPAPPETPLPPWIAWNASEENRRSGKYTVQPPYGHRTVTVSPPNGDQPEPEPEPIREVVEEAKAQTVSITEEVPAPQSKTEPEPEPDHWELWFDHKFCRPPSETRAEDIRRMVGGGMSHALVIHMLKLAVEREVRNKLSYAAAILGDLYAAGVRTVEGCEAYESKRGKGRSTPQTVARLPTINEILAARGAGDLVGEDGL